MSDFYKDLNAAKTAEKIALDVLSYTTENYAFKDVSDIEEYWHKGDIIAYNDRDTFYIDVKDDSVIHKTGNILCEERVYYRKSKKFADGFMYSDYDYLAIVSQPEKKIYLINFDVLKRHYKEGFALTMQYSWQYSDTYLFSLEKAKEYKMIEAVIEYDGDDKECYPVSCTKYFN